MNFGIFTLVGVIMLVLSGASFGYLVQVKNKTRSSFLLLWFFLCIMLSSIATILTNSGFDWSRALAPSQDAMLLLGGVFLLSYAYAFPTNDQPQEARIAVAIYGVLMVTSLAYSIYFVVVFIANLPAQIAENQVIYLITPIAILFGVIVFFRRSLHWSATRLSASEKKMTTWRWGFSALFKPGPLPALALRNFGLALALSLIPVLVILIKPALPPLFSSFLFNFSVVIAISAVMLVYLNHAPETSTLTAKLVGISLVTVLLILGFAGVWFIMGTPSDLTHNIVVKFMILVPVCSLLIILLFPLFFRPTLLQPLNRLLQGVGVVNQGNLDVQVDVRYDDEVGFLTRSFNRMVLSLKTSKQDLEYAARSLETQVEERTQALQATNEKLVGEIQSRIEIETTLDRQLAYEQALADCSRLLLLPAGDDDSQTEIHLAGTRQQILTQAIEYLREAAGASRAYIFVNFQDAELGLCTGMVAESCSPGIPAQIDNPTNQKFPWTQLPVNMLKSLGAAQPYGGPTEVVFSSTPELLISFHQQEFPILSIELFPIFLGNHWWGFIGFDDCTRPREWEPQEIAMLQTASEMVGNTVQRWEVEEDLKNTLHQLEDRVKERTLQYIQANQELRREINARERFQDELMERLTAEETLAKISARLLSPVNVETAIQETIRDLGELVKARRIHFIQHPSIPIKAIPEVIGLPQRFPDNGEPDTRESLRSRGKVHQQGHPSDDLEPGRGLVNYLDADYAWFHHQLQDNQVVFIPDHSALPEDASLERELLVEMNITSLLLIPLFMDNELSAVIAVRDLIFPKVELTIQSLVQSLIQSLDVIADMLSSFLSRVNLLNILEEKVSERTRELSTFFDMTMLAGEAQELGDVMQPALVKIMEISSCDSALIHTYDENDSTLTLVSHRGISSRKRVLLNSIPVDEVTQKWLQQLDADQLDAGHASLSAVPSPFRFSAFKSCMHIALRARGKTQGLLSCYRQENNSFSPYQVNFLSMISEQLGMAVESHRLRLKARDIATYQERQRLARDLHDAVSQSLYSLVLYARSGRDAFEAGDNMKLADSLEQVEHNAQAALREMRLLLYQLRSGSLEEGGFAGALRSRLDLVEQRSGIKTDVSIDESMRVPVQVELELFRMVTEALNNALKHSSASYVSVVLKSGDSSIIMMVEDNGKGFDPSLISAGMGLQNLRDRTALLGGNFGLTSAPGKGTSIRVEIPQEPLPGSDGIGEASIEDLN